MPSRAKRVKFPQEQKDKRPQVRNGKSFVSAKEQSWYMLNNGAKWL